MIYQIRFSRTKENKFVQIYQHCWDSVRKFWRLRLFLKFIDRPETKAGDFILRDGTLRSLQVKQSYLVKLGEYAHPKVLNVKKNPIKTAQNMLNFGRKIKVYLFDSDYKFISQDCQRYLERTAKKRLSSIEQSSVL
jgi:hypothetical protein